MCVCIKIVALANFSEHFEIIVEYDSKACT